MWTRRLFVALATVAALTAAVSAGPIIDHTRLTYMTFSGPVGLPGVTLPAGTYRFELADPNVSLNIVRVRSQAGSTVYFTGFTDRVERPDGLPAGPHISLGEVPRGAITPILAWYPEGDSVGHRFRYRATR
jgi:hypothetical protein